MNSSANASRVPEVGGGPSTSIFVAGSDEFTSFQVLYGFAIERVRVRRIRDLLREREVHVLRDSFMFAVFLLCASTMPS